MDIAEVKNIKIIPLLDTLELLVFSQKLIYDEFKIASMYLFLKISFSFGFNITTEV